MAGARLCDNANASRGKINKIYYPTLGNGFHIYLLHALDLRLDLPIKGAL